MNRMERLNRISSMAVHNPMLFLFSMIAKIRAYFIFNNSPFEKSLSGGTTFRFDFNFDPEIKSMYLGTYEIETISAMKKILKKGDTFIDVGANIGYISTTALGLVGKNGSVHSFEPVTEYFAKLKEAVLLNPKHKFIVNHCALGESIGTVKIAVTNLRNIGWNTIVPGFMTNDTIKKYQDVPIHRLDNYIKEKTLNNVKLIKIDTEGFEFPVLKGLSGYFKNCKVMPTIICEIVPSAYPLLGYKLDQLSEYMKKFKYDAFEINNPKRKIDITKLEKTTNVLFLSKQ